MSSIRLLRGDPRVLDLPKVLNDNILAGDILYVSAGDSAVRPASAAPGADHDAKSGAVGANFAGIAMADRLAGDPGRVPVATAGDFMLPTSGTPAIRAMVRVIDVSGTPSSTTVEATTTAGMAIGRTLDTASGGRVEVRILSRFNEVA
jgi:hypothetical protein